ncbi:MAG: hypothetical protein E6Q97_06640 [Desulfurellales bacterium]|nr:MAG: hypothetical protein E6Q97_06640 [Desulfurellales bacterium]
MPSVNVNSTHVPAKTIVNGVTLTLSHEEAQILRRAMYYNLTVADKFARNPKGGWSKSARVKSVMASIGESLKAKGIERF